jgi:hypothetical protein
MIICARYWLERSASAFRASNGKQRLMSGVFFPRSTAAAGVAGSAADHILIQQLLPTAGQGMHIQTQEIGQQSVAAMAQAERLQPGKQPPLLFVEQAIEQ